MKTSQLLLLLTLVMIGTPVFAKRIEITVDNIYSPTYNHLMTVAHRDCYPDPICYKPYPDQIWFDVNLDGKTIKMNLKNGKTFVFDSFDIDTRAEEIAFLKAGKYGIPKQKFNLCCRYHMFPGSGTVDLAWEVYERIFENDSSSFYLQLKEEFNNWVSQLREAIAQGDKQRVSDLKPLILEVLKSINDEENQNGVRKKTSLPRDLNILKY